VACADAVTDNINLLVRKTELVGIYLLRGCSDFVVQAAQSGKLPITAHIVGLQPKLGPPHELIRNIGAFEYNGIQH
jgi:hypothetical protein